MSSKKKNWKKLNQSRLKQDTTLLILQCFIAEQQKKQVNFIRKLSALLLRLLMNNLYHLWPVFILEETYVEVVVLDLMEGYEDLKQIKFLKFNLEDKVVPAEESNVRQGSNDRVRKKFNDRGRLSWKVYIFLSLGCSGAILWSWCLRQGEPCEKGKQLSFWSCC